MFFTCGIWCVHVANVLSVNPLSEQNTPLTKGQIKADTIHLYLYKKFSCKWKLFCKSSRLELQKISFSRSGACSYLEQFTSKDS